MPSRANAREGIGLRLLHERQSTMKNINLGAKEVHVGARVYHPVDRHITTVFAKVPDTEEGYTFFFLTSGEVLRLYDGAVLRVQTHS